MGRSPCCSKEGLNRGAWTAHEDKILMEFIKVHGEGRWRNLPKSAGLKRCGKSCRLRWLNYLRPDIKRGNISSDEEELIIRLHKLLGNRWSLIAGRLPGRTDNEIKNYWNTNLGKKVKDGYQSSCHGKSRRENPKSETMATPELSSLVVRTKATKCSKVLLLNSHSSTQLQNKSNAEAQVVEATNALPSNSPTTNPMEPCLYDNGFTSFHGEEKELPTDLLIDFNVEDISLCDLLNSDFSDMCDFSSSNVENNNSEQLSPCSDQTPILCDEILKNSFADQTNVSNNLHSFLSFLESGEE
ncbi:hypothetical protein VNO77_05427 [Canavalia gladiata]|uniref:Myb-related protein 123 n=1 Tax=Canavalia gladiata TaxID=3824 RepID=A0AAN9R8N5_CANGL